MGKSPVRSQAVDDEQILAETIAETIQEVRFYTAHAMHDQARAALEKLEQLRPDAAMLAAIQEEVAAAGALASIRAAGRRGFDRSGRGSRGSELRDPDRRTEVAEVESASQFGPWGSKTPLAEPTPPAPVFPAVAALSPPAEAAEPQPSEHAR